MIFKEGDIYRWYFKKPSDHMPYHCCSNIAIVRKGKLFDTYWSMFDEHSKRWTEESAEQLLELTYLGNFEDLVKVDSYNEKYYNKEDIVNLNHRNSSNNNFYIRKGAVRSKERMLKELEYRRIESLSKIDSLKRSVEDIDRNIKMINEGVDLEIVHIYNT